jgi:hypothetical protein
MTVPSAEEWLALIERYAAGELPSDAFLDQFFEFRNAWSKADFAAPYPMPFEEMVEEVFMDLDDSWLMNAPGHHRQFHNESELREAVIGSLQKFKSESSRLAALDRLWDESHGRSKDF